MLLGVRCVRKKWSTTHRQPIGVCFARSGICNKTYSAAGSSSVEIQCRNLRWHFTSRDPVAGLAAADLRYLPSPRRLLVT